MSHSGPVALYAVAREAEVGVDVERPRRRLDAIAVAERAFGSASAIQLGRLEEAEREREFLRLWVRHEAQLKCRGVGLGGVESGKGDPACWTKEVEVGGRMAAAVAAARTPATVELAVAASQAAALSKRRGCRGYPLRQ
jgi:phosphopantetheinyl transferase